MDRTENIVKDYLHADSELRLYMFLAYPELRAAFTKMDLERRPLVIHGRSQKADSKNRKTWVFWDSGHCCDILRRCLAKM